MLEVNPTYLEITTPHYKYELTLIESTQPLHKITFIAGREDKPCLEGSVILANNTKNNRLNSMVNTAKLIKIDALQECSLEDIDDAYMAKYSFGTELLDSIIFLINSQFASIETMSLNDASYIPCIRDSKDTLDLLIYSIALYKKTWYEERLNAYIKPAERYDKYRKQVEAYASKENKSRLDFTDIYKLILSGSSFTVELFEQNKDLYKEQFEKAQTLPEFFQMLSKTIKREEKCRFFKDWLESFISSQIDIERLWYFDLFPKIQRLSSLTNKIKGTSRKTRKVRRG